MKEIQEKQQQNGNQLSQEERQKNIDNLPKDKKGRIIIRNLQFDLKENHLKNLFNKFGKIIDVKVPLNPTNNQNKGFGFVEFENKNMALKAIKELNNSDYKGRKIFLDFSVSQDVYKKIQHNKQKINDQSQAQADQTNEEEQKKNDEDKNQNDTIPDNDKKNKQLEDQQKIEKLDENINNQKKKNKKNDLEGTLFVKNISYEMTEDQFYKFFEKFGKLQYAKIVKQKDTGLSNGTGFIKYRDIEISNQLLSGSLDNNNLLFDLEFNGRQMNLQKAVDRNEINKQQQQDDDNESGENKEQLNSKQPNIKKISTLEKLVLTDRNGKRNLNLALLGTLQIPQNELQEKDKIKRDNHYQEKIEKLKNPNKFVSPTRIVIKGMPKNNFDESDIKNFVQEFLNKYYSKKDIKHKKFIKQVQLLKEKQEVVNTQDEKISLKSKGIAFVEFIENQVALKFMEYLIQDQQYKNINQKSIPIIEFAIQDIRIINKKLAIFDKKNQHQQQMNQKKKEQQKLQQKLDKQTGGGPKSGEDQASKLIIEEIIQNNKFEQNQEKVKQLLQNMKSRGIKQRLKKRILKQFGDFKTIEQKSQKPQSNNKLFDKINESINQYQNLKNIKKKENKIINKKAQKEKNNINQIKEKQQDESQIQENKEIKKIRNQIKNLRKNKRRENDHDEFDEIALKYEEKIRKKQKWTNAI